MFTDQTTTSAAQYSRPLPLEPREEEVCQLAAHLNAGVCRWLEAVAEHERDGEWGGPGLRSYAHWLSWRCGVSLWEAREYVRVAQRLPELPLIRAAFARGELSYAKVRSLTRVANPHDEQGLLEVAGTLTTSQLERVVQVYRRVTREQAADSHERSFLSYCWEGDGSLLLRARLPAEDGAVLVRALEAARDSLRRSRAAQAKAAEPKTSEDYPPPDPLQLLARPSNIDALIAVAESALASEAGERTGGDRWQIVVHVDADALTDDDRGRCQLEDGPAIAAETARRLACDSSLVRITERDGQPLSVGRRTRTIPPALRRALRARDHRCQFPGCNNTRFLHAHHARHWADGGETSLDNLILLCSAHHRLVHEGDYTTRRDGAGRIRFHDQRGTPIPYAPPRLRGESNGIRKRNRRNGLCINGHTANNGTGERMELAYVGDMFLGIVQRPE